MNERILVIDDDPVLLGTVQEIAAVRGATCRSASTHDQFLASLGNPAPDYIILDPAIPELDGIEIIQHLSRHQCDAGLIIASSLETRLADAVRRAATGKGLNVVGMLPKPVTGVALRELIGTEKRGSFEYPHERTLVTPDRESALHTAVEENGFQLFYQPKVSCRTGDLVGFEALARWKLPDGTILLPHEFIPLAEQTGLIQAITEQLLDQAFRWIASTHHDRKVALCVNLPATVLNDVDFPDYLAALCRVRDIEPGRIVLELTETATMEDPETALEMVTRLRLKGFHAAIDDVGTGYSSLSQLARLPFSELKVDRTFVRRVRSSDECRTIVDAFIQLGHRLGLWVIAEGVEDRETLDYLATNGCDFAQGYFIARPMAAAAAAEWNRQLQAT